MIIAQGKAESYVTIKAKRQVYSTSKAMFYMIYGAF